jgi:transcriptional regulator with XRE-family HTH domain
LNQADFNTPLEILGMLGERVRRIRLQANISQADLAARAHVSDRAVRMLEKGRGSSLITLVRVLKALDALSSLDALVPVPSISPMALLERGAAPKRASPSGK